MLRAPSERVTRQFVQQKSLTMTKVSCNRREFLQGLFEPQEWL